MYAVWDRFEGGVEGLATVYLFVQNYHPTPAINVMGQAWTLDLEVAFYIVIPLASLLSMWAAGGCARHRGQRLAIVLTVLAAAYALSLQFKHDIGNPIALTYNIADYLFAFHPGGGAGSDRAVCGAAPAQCRYRARVVVGAARPVSGAAGVRLAARQRLRACA